MESVSFDRIADRYDESRGGRFRAEYIAAGVADHLVDGGVLEIGVGTGAISSALADRGRTCVGVDLSAGMLQVAAGRLGPRVARGDAQRLPVRSASCSNVLLVWVLHLVGDPVAALREAGRVLVEGGQIVTVRANTGLERDDIEPIVEQMRLDLRRTQGRPDTDDIPALAAAAGLTHVRHNALHELTYPESPHEQVARIEQRTFSSLWDVEPAAWQTLVEPAIAALRALPDPDRKRQRSLRQDVDVFTRR